MLEFHLSTIVFTVINLLVLYLFLRKFLFGRINAILDQRRALIQDSIDAAERSNSQAETLRRSYEEKLAEAQQEADQITSAAHARAPMWASHIRE